MKTVTLSLPDSLAAHLEQNFAFYGYGDASEYAAEVLREQQGREREALEDLLLEGLNSGDPIPVTPAFWTEFRADTDVLLAEHQQGLKKVSAA